MPTSDVNLVAPRYAAHTLKIKRVIWLVLNDYFLLLYRSVNILCMSEPSDQDDIDLFRQEIGDIEHLTQDKITHTKNINRTI